jgi:formylglycine-generating enzyme required for sulfatase activity
MGVFEVTVGQFRKFVDATKYKTLAEKNGKGGWAFDASLRFTQGVGFNWRTPGFMQQDDCPVVQIVWDDALAYCLWASSQEPVAYRLPTEAEWEYACRAGTATSYCFGDDAKGLQQTANTGDLSLGKFLRLTGNDALKGFMPWDDEYGCTSPVGRFLPNPFGLHDMLGNAWEWCSDWFNGDYAETGTAEDPQGAMSGRYRVMRGGCYGEGKPKAFRSAFRGGLPEHSIPQMSTGFRVVCEVERSK